MKKTKKTSKKKKKHDTVKQYNNYAMPNGPTLYSNNQMNYNYPGQQQVQIMQPGYPNQQVSPYNGYPQTPMPNPQIDYSLIASINQLQHQSIYQEENNTLFITLGTCYKVFPFIFLILGLGMIPVGFLLVKNNNKYIVIALGAIFFLGSIIMMCRGYHSVYFFLGVNDLTVTKKSLCGRNTTIYGPGELISIELSHYTTHKSGRKLKTRKTMHNYQLDIVTTSGNERVFKVAQNKVLFTYEEIGYFNYVLNSHIQTRMRI